MTQRHTHLFLLLLLYSFGLGGTYGEASGRKLLQAAAPAPASAPGQQRATSPSAAPLASLGPLPGAGLAIVVTLDLWGPGLLTFDLRQQELLLEVMNETIVDAESDELQLLKVEDILPLSGPAAVTFNGNRPSTGSENTNVQSGAPSPAFTATGRRRKLLQLASAGNSSNISAFQHLQVQVRVSCSPGQETQLQGEIRNAVGGPILPLLNDRGVDLRYLVLTSMSVDYGNGIGPSGPPRPASGLSGGDIAGIAIAGSIGVIGLTVGSFVLSKSLRGRQQARARSEPYKKPGAGSDSSNEESGSSGTTPEMLRTHLDSLLYPELAGSRNHSPHMSLADSMDSRSSSEKTLRAAKAGNGSKPGTGNGIDASLWNVPFNELQFSRIIGEGSFGRVYLAKWQETTVAVKILTAAGGPLPDDSWDPQDVTQLKDCTWLQSNQGQTPAQTAIVEELRKEASLMASLRHPNVVLFLGVCLQPPCMVTEFCARGSLLDVLHRARTNKAAAAELDWRRRLRLALDAAKGMHYLHSRQPQILHRDLKSANLLVDKHWQAKVADFNLSRVMQPSAAVSSLAATNPRWLPPEVLSGKAYNSAADVYAFGIILWELMVWEIPWKDDSPWQVVISVVDFNHRPEIPEHTDLPGGLPAASQHYLELMETCWHTEPGQRPTYESIINHMRTLIDAEDAKLMQLMQQQGVSVAVSAPPQPLKAAGQAPAPAAEGQSAQTAQ